MHVSLSITIKHQILPTFFTVTIPDKTDIRTMHLSIWSPQSLEPSLLFLVDKLRSLFKIATLNRLANVQVARTKEYPFTRIEYNFELKDKSENIDKLLRHFGFMIKI